MNLAEPHVSIPLQEYLALLHKGKSQLLSDKFTLVQSEQKVAIEQALGWQLKAHIVELDSTEREELKQLGLCRTPEVYYKLYSLDIWLEESKRNTQQKLLEQQQRAIINQRRERVDKAIADLYNMQQGKLEMPYCSTLIKDYILKGMDCAGIAKALGIEDLIEKKN